MTSDQFNSFSQKQCTSLTVVLKGEGVLGGPHSVSFEYNFKASVVHISIEQGMVRTIKIIADSPVPILELWEFYNDIERLLMLLDGRFYIIKSAEFAGDACSKTKYASYMQECLIRRLTYFKTDPVYIYHSHKFLSYDTVLSRDLLAKWITWQEELDIIHPIALYNIADTGITHDIKCVFIIEVFEPIAEVSGICNKSNSSPKSCKQKITLKVCLDAVISKYGQDIFAKECSVNQDRFLQILVNTRNRMMHIKRTQSANNYLSASESVLYLVKLCHLYRVVLLSLLGIDYSQYQTAVVKSVEQWNSWNGVLTNFINRIK